MIGARANAAQIIHAVIHQKIKLGEALSRHSIPLSDPRDTALRRELCSGVLRYLPRLAFVFEQLGKCQIKTHHQVLRYVIYSGLYQMELMRIPDHAAVSSSVDACRELGIAQASGMVNAVLRRYQSQRKKILAQVLHNECAHHAHPLWLLQKLRSVWPDHWQQLLASNNDPPPMHLRVNLQQHSRTEYQQQLQQAGITAYANTYLPALLSLPNAVTVAKLPGFTHGACSVQNAAAQWAAEIMLAVLPDSARVLDACAAPGGKTCAWLERCSLSSTLLAIEKSKKRSAKLQENLQRCGYKIPLIHADISALESWWDGKTFDGIFLDVPCSGTGVIRQHPDIKSLCTPERISTLCNTQRELLQSCWQTLHPGGKLLYMSCSVLPEENMEQIKYFLQKHANCHLLPLDHTTMPAIHTDYGSQILSGMEDMDGFFYALLEKTSDKA